MNSTSHSSPDSLKKSNRSRTISIRAILIAGFAGLTGVGIAAALIIGLGAAVHNTQELLAKQADEIVSRLAGEIYNKLNPAERQAQWIAGQVRNDKLPFREFDYAKLGAFFDIALSATPQIKGAAFFDTKGTFNQWARNGEGVQPEDWSDRKVVMTWVAKGATGPKPIWGPPIWLETLEEAVIIYETPLFDSKGYLGYLALAVSISDLSAQLAKISKNPFVFYGKTDVLAHPIMIDWRPLGDRSDTKNIDIYSDQSALLSLKDLGDPVLERIWNADFENLVVLRKMTQSQAVAAQVGERSYVYLYRSVEGYGPKPWIIGTYLDTDEDDATVDRVRMAAVVGVALLVIAITASIFVARAIGRPIQRLSEASQAVRAEQYEQIPELPGSYIREFDTAMSNFQGMVSGLTERDKIRRTLGRYVPRQIAEILLKNEAGLTPVEAEATVLFCDVAGFTALTEELGPTRIVEVLNAYFSRMTEIIESHNGVITQFQGDAILAIFNVPIEMDDHAKQACLAAIEMQRAVQNETFAGQVLHNRTGVNTGPVVAGAVGAKGRLTYTVHGDAVNRAARLETLNKDLGTSVLISESTVKLIDGLTVREVGETTLRGQTGPVRLYTTDIQG
jgi:adenylate cyclase